MASPEIHTYHCICTTHLLSSTHLLSQLPHRQTLDSALILPLSTSPPPPPTQDPSPPLPPPPQGWTIPTSLIPDKRILIIRREDGFEKRMLYRCSRCRLVIGYEITSRPQGGKGKEVEVEEGGMDLDGEGEGERYEGKVLYVLPNSLMSTEAMREGKKIKEEDVDIPGGGGKVGGGVFELVA